MLARSRSDNVEQLLRGGLPRDFVEVRNHSLKETEGDDHVEFSSFDPVNGRNSDAGSLAEYRLR